MGFIERIISIAQNKNENNIERQKTFLTPFTSNSLKRKSLKADTYQASSAVEKQGLLPKNYQNKASVGNVFDEHNALVNPQKFIDSYANIAVLQKALDTNPEIRRILEENKLPVKFELDNVTSIAESHLIPTAKKAQEVYKNAGHSASEKSYVHLTQAALLHDIGKAFIPSEILNKRGFLTPRERNIIELHNRLSYEILRTTNLSPKVAQYALEHHNYDGKVKKSPENQSLTMADVYCALREKRPYKRSLSDIEAKAVMCNMSTNGIPFDTSFILYV